MSLPRSTDVALVASGAAAGAVARWGVTHLEPASGFPWVTLTVNVVGAFLLGALPAVPAVRRSRRAALVLGPGFLGGFTTVSAWAGQVTELAADGRSTSAALLVVTTVGAAVLAAQAGRWCVRSSDPASGRPAGAGTPA